MSKRKLPDDNAVDAATVRQQRAAFLASMSRGISPPRSSRTPEPRGQPSTAKSVIMNGPATAQHSRQDHSLPSADAVSVGCNPQPSETVPRLISSPFKLTKIRDLPASSNLDTVSLHDILGNPLIKEVWVFNFCFDIDWMMQYFDADVRDAVKVKIIHGSWRKEDGNKIGIDEACKIWPCVEATAAYLPDAFGTHHSKMFVLFTHDDSAEVIIHTANMLAKDWTNMTQAVWRSGRLAMSQPDDGELADIGSGSRFKYDLLEYIRAYKRPAKSLVEQLRNYDFSAVRGALVASVPARIDNIQTKSTSKQHLWGYPQLREVIAYRWSSSNQTQSATPHLVAQVSSIATLHNGWLDTLIDSFSGSTQKRATSQLSLIYPTAPNVAASLDGYAAGGSIHTKAQSAAHLKQINSLRPHLCQWTGNPSTPYKSQRELAAPHIKTYIQFNAEPTKARLDADEIEVEWAFVTSANLSTQAWGSMPKSEGKGSGKNATQARKDGLVQIQSFEIGVLVWPELSAESEEEASTIRMVPVFGKDSPDIPPQRLAGSNPSSLVGLRMPYDLPLTKYSPGELPWSPQGSHPTPDSRGMAWIR
jgi:tyrosyl-DNA phosphodiesterase 1